MVVPGSPRCQFHYARITVNGKHVSLRKPGMLARGNHLSAVGQDAAAVPAREPIQCLTLIPFGR